MSRKKYLILAKAYDKRGRLMATSHNDYKKSHPIMREFAIKVGLPKKEYLHAEVCCLLRCRDKVPYKITVERYDADGNPALAKPCEVCQEAIKVYGVEKVCYTSPEGWKTIKVKEL